MGKILSIDRHDVEIAVKQYYKDYEPDLYERFNFDDFTLYVDSVRKGYLGVEYSIPERDEAVPSKLEESK